jgi:hypothetical protein
MIDPASVAATAKAVTGSVGPLAQVAALLKGERGARRRARRGDRFDRIYAPLRELLLDVHITYFGENARYPYLRLRVRRFWRHFRNAGLRGSFRLLFDKGKSRSSVVVEFGYFPLEEILAVVKQNVRLADGKLLSLVQAVNRSRYEAMMNYSDDGRDSGGERELDEDEVALMEHIFDQHAVLLKALDRGA